MDWNFPDKLETEALFKLIDVLLTFDCMKSTDSRNQVISHLGPDIENGITRFPAAKPDVNSIVRTCLQYSGGMKKLYEALRFFEGETATPWRKLQSTTAEILGESLKEAESETRGEGRPGAAASQSSTQAVGGKALFDQIVEITLPYMDDVDARKPLVQAALIDCPLLPNIRWDGSAATFTRRLALQLLEFGEVAPGKPAWAALLEEIRPQAGKDRKAQIDRLLKQPLGD